MPAAYRNLPAEWRWERLDEVCDGVYDCPHSTPKLTDSGPYVARTQDISTGVFREDRAARVSEETYLERTARAVPSRGDLLYSREGTYFGIAAEVPKDTRVCLGQRMVLIRPSPEKLDFRFLRYWLNSPTMSTHINGFRDGSVAERLNLPTIRSLPVLCPPIHDQRKIADVLSALDDKVRVNEQITARADSLGELHFKRFRNSARGSTRTTFGEIAGVFGGGTPRTTEPSYWGGEVCWATPTDVTRLSSLFLFETESRITPSGLANCASTLHPRGSILMTSRATIGRFAINDVPVATNQGFIVVRPRVPADKWWLLYEMRSRVDEMVSISNGSTFLELSRRNFKDMEIVMPAGVERAVFNTTADALQSRARMAAMENRTLAELRNTLLPKLLSGQLRISDVEQHVNTAV